MQMVLPETSKVVFQCVCPSVWELNVVVFKDVFFSPTLGMPGQAVWLRLLLTLW